LRAKLTAREAVLSSAAPPQVRVCLEGAVLASLSPREGQGEGTQRSCVPGGYRGRNAAPTDPYPCVGAPFPARRVAGVRPSVSDLLEPAQQELAKAHHRFDDPEDRLHRRLAQPTDRTASRGLERLLHLLDAAGRF